MDELPDRKGQLRTEQRQHLPEIEIVTPFSKRRCLSCHNLWRSTAFVDGSLQKSTQYNHCHKGGLIVFNSDQFHSTRSSPFSHLLACIRVVVPPRQLPRLLPMVDPCPQYAGFLHPWIFPVANYKYWTGY